jgi:hypothetical protein
VDAEPTWTDLIVSEAKQNMQARTPVTENQNRIRQIKSAIKRLSDENLALQNVGDLSRPYPLMLLHESATTDPERRDYLIPEYHTDAGRAVALPIEFFTRGWIYLLTDSEIRMYLILQHLASRFPQSHLMGGVYLTERERTGLYGVSRDVYESHLMLTRFGLIEQVPSSNRHPDGKVIDYARVVSESSPLSPHHFRVLGERPFFEQPAEKINRALRNFQYRKSTADDSPRSARARRGSPTSLTAKASLYKQDLDPWSTSTS